MTNFSPKIEIINHFDNLVNKLDIEIDVCLEKCKQVLGQILENSSAADRDKFREKNASSMLDYTLRLNHWRIIYGQSQPKLSII